MVSLKVMIIIIMISSVHDYDDNDSDLLRL